MAAKLKKRALAEFSHVIQEEVKPVKRLRLIQRPAVQEIQLGLQSAATPQEALQALVRLEQKFPMDQAAAERLFPELMEHYNKSRHTVLRCKILAIFGRLAVVPGFNPQVISDQLLSKLKLEESHKVLSAMVNVLATIGRCLPNSPTFHLQLVSAAHGLLTTTSHLVRAGCLALIGELGSCDDKAKDLLSASSSSSSVSESVLQLLGHYTSDDDSRVRTSAFQAMLRLYERGQCVSQGVYSQACSGLGDDSEEVRRVAVRLVWVLGKLYPDSMVSTVEGGEDLRLVDDGFAKICNMMNDISVRVRVESAALLGSMHQVSPRFLEQTLDKKLMSNMRRKVSAHDRAKEQFESGEWATGAKWADDRPKENLDADSVSLMNIGACGAFVHGLEDEYLEVRNASLDSLCELAYQSPRFALLCLDSIIDMVNDEIESVRLNTINSLRKLSPHLVLRHDQLMIILAGLQDFSFSSREALQGLLGEIQMGTRESVNSTIMALLDNLRRYPEDRASIWSCCQRLGRRHPQLTMMLAEELLCLHPYFLSPEPDMDDPAYIAVLLAVFNAAALCPTMVALFPEHTRRHYLYLRSSLPHLVPPIQALEDSGGQVGVEEGQVGVSVNKTGDFVRSLLAKLSGLPSLDLATAQQLLHVATRDLQRVKTLDGQFSACTECTCLFLSSQLLLTQLAQGVLQSDAGVVYGESVSAAVDKIVQQTTALRTLYVGTGVGLTALLMQTEVKALTLQLLSTLSRAALGDKVRACSTFKQYLALIKSEVDSEADLYDTFTKQVVALCHTLDWSRLHTLHEILRDLSSLLRPATLVTPCDVRKTSAIIHEPPPTSDNAIKFPAGLAASVMLVATIDDLEDPNHLAVLVRYPDQRTQLVTPQLSAWTRLSPLRHRLATPVLLTHALWSESCQVELSLVVEARGPGRQLLKVADTIPLTQPVTVLVAPKPAKR